MKFFSRENQLDEMQEQTQRKTESTGFWLAWTGLLAAFLIQVAMDKPLENWIAECLVFIVVDIYLVVSCLKNGIWDRHLRANTGTNLVSSIVIGFVVAMLTFFAGYRYWPGALITGLCTMLLCFVALQFCVKLYNKRHSELEKEENEDEDD